MSEIMLSVPDEALSAMKMTPSSSAGNFAWPEPSSSTRWDGCHQGQRRKSRHSPNCLPHEVGRLWGRHFSDDGRGFPSGDAA